jgi:DNA-3-methyladenine glycosylase II
MPALELPDRHDVHRTLAEAHLRKAEPRFAPIIDAVGPCTLVCETNLFRSLARAIVSQLISTAAARTINERLEVALKRKVLPSRLLALSDEELRGCGISGGKSKSLRALADLFQRTRGLNAKLLAADDDTIRELLLPLHGIGPWTIDMFLIFAMGRPDVWPVGDLGVRAGMKDVFKLKELPDAKAMAKLAEPWRPYRTYAAWYLWRSRGWEGQPEAT